MSISEAHEPIRAVGAASAAPSAPSALSAPVATTAPTRRAVLAVGGGIGLAALLSACGGSELSAAPTPTASPAAPAAASPPRPLIARGTPVVRITTTGSTFNPTVELAAGSKATVSWAVEGGSTVTGLDPVINFGTAARRRVLMTARDDVGDALDQVVLFNLGFNHLDDLGRDNLGAGSDKAGQAVTLVENISALTGLRAFASAHTPLAGPLDFSGCSQLQFIECFSSRVQWLDLTGCTSLVRLVMEQTNLANLDLNPVAATLQDLRGAAQRGGRLTLTPLSAPMAALYHFCVRDQVLVNHPGAARLPVVEELWDWNTGQSGALRPASGALDSLLTYRNGYTTADLTGRFPAGRQSVLEASHNRLTTIALTGCSGLHRIDLGNNRLGRAAVDGVLALVASWGTSGGLLNLTDNSVPGRNGMAARAALTGRGWKVSTDT